MNRDTRAALLDLAERNARSRGFDGFSYADLAATIGIKKASIHYHFPTKADLSECLIERYHTNLKHRLAEIGLACPTAGARLKALVSMYREALHDGQTVCLCVAFSIGRGSLPVAVVNRVGGVRAMTLEWLRIAFELGLRDMSISAICDPAHEAHATLAMLEGAHLAARAAEDPAPFDAATGLLEARCKTPG